MVHPRTIKQISTWFLKNKHLKGQDPYDLFYWYFRELASYPKRHTYPKNVTDAKNIINLIEKTK